MSVKISTFTTTTDGTTGLGTISVKIPGTFSGFDSTSASWQGRQLLKAGVWLENRAVGDMINAAYINDTDGVIPVPARGAFPNYPVIKNLHDDSMSSANQGITFPPESEVFKVEFPSNMNAKVAAGLYLVITAKKAIPAVDTVVVNLAMDDAT